MLISFGGINMLLFYFRKERALCINHLRDYNRELLARNTRRCLQAQNHQLLQGKASWAKLYATLLGQVLQRDGCHS